MSELQELAQRIKESDSKKSKSISERDLNKITDKMVNAQKNISDSAQKAASKAVNDTVSSLTSKIPSANSIKSAFLGSVPMLSGLGGIIEKSNKLFTSSVKDLADTSEQQNEKLTNTLEPASTNDDGLMSTEIVSIRQLLEEAVEQLKYSNNLEENIIDEDRRNKLSSLGTDTDPTVSPTNNTDKLLEDLLEGQDDANSLATLDFLSGKGGILSVLSGLLGSSGLFSSSGMFVKGLKLITKNGLKFLGPVGLVAAGLFELYEGFTSADEYFGEAVSIPKKIQYAVVHLFSSLLAPIDWAIEALTGEESNLRGSFEDIVINLQGAVMEFLEPLLEIPLALVKWSINFYKEIFAGIGTDTQLSELPTILYGNISKYVSESMVILGNKFQDGISAAFEVMSSIPDKFVGLFDGMGDMLKSLFNSTLESMTAGLSDSIGFGIGDKISEQLNALKFDIGDPEVPTSAITKTVSSAVNKDPEYAKERMTQARARVQEIKNKARAKSFPVAPNEKSLGERSEPLIFKETPSGKTSEDSYGAKIVKAIEDLRAAQKPNQVVTSAPVTSNQSTTVVKSGMNTYSGTRKLVPENW